MVLKNQKHEQFCQLVSSGVTPTKAYSKIYGKGKSDASGATRLSKKENVCQRLLELRNGVADELIEVQIGLRDIRLTWLEDIGRRMKMVLEARAAQYSDIPGGDSGLLVKSLVKIGQGKEVEYVDEYAVDTGLLREFREYMKQAAIEKMQWTEKRELTGKNGSKLFTLTDVDALLAESGE